MDNNTLLWQAVCVISICLIAGIGITFLPKKGKKSESKSVDPEVTQESGEQSDGQSVDI